MRIDLLILQLAVVFLPGIVWAQLDASYAAKTRRSDTEFFLRAFLFGLVAYAVEFLLFQAIGRPFLMVSLADAPATGVVSTGVLFEVLGGLAIGTLLAVGWLYASRFKLLPRVLQRIGATKKFGDEDVWDFTFNTTGPEVEYIHFRDFDNRLVYAGWVSSFSETDKVRELVLLNVILYDFDGQELYRTPRLYLARPTSSIHIEFPYRSNDQPGAYRDAAAPDAATR